MKQFKKVLALLLAAMTIFSLAACGSKDTAQSGDAQGTADSTQNEEPKSKIDQIKEAGVLVVGTSADYPPFQFHTQIDGQDTIVGVEISIVQYIADDLGVDLKIVDMDFNALVVSLAQGDFDIVASTMRPTEKRRESVDFSNAWHQNQNVLVVRKGEEANYATPEDLAGHKVAAQTGASQYDTAAEYAGEANVVGLNKVQNMILEVKTGKVDAVLLESLVAQAYAANNDDLSVVDVGFEKATENASLGVQKGNEDFVEYLNEKIAEMTEKGLIEQYVADAQTLADGE